MAEEKKAAEEIKKAADGSKLSQEDLEQVAGGGNPFKDFVRVPNQDYDDSVRRKA